MSPEEWEKLRKHGSWMRELEFLEDEDEISRDVFDVLLRRSHSEPLCPRLLKLSWVSDSVFGGYFVHFLSPQLREVQLASRSGTVFSFPHAISALPTSSLETLRLSVIGDESVKRAIFSLFKTVPGGLKMLEVSHMDQLWDGAWCRIMVLLPRLRTLETDQFPPSQSPPSAPVFFFPLRQASFRGPGASRWIHFLSENCGQSVVTPAGPKPRTVAPLLSQLYCDFDVQLDSPLMSCFRVFQNLSSLRLGGGCSSNVCAFRLTDEDVSQFATQLPRLRRLSLGFVCALNTCTTTANSLLTLSVHCKELRELRIHFNTRNFARDVGDSLRNPLRRNPWPPSRCPLTVLDVGWAPLSPSALGVGLFPTLVGLVDIFPQLQGIKFHSGQTSLGWRLLNAHLPNLQEMRRSLPAVFSQ